MKINMFYNNHSTNETTLSVTCDSNGNWIPNPADFIQSCLLFSIAVSLITGTIFFTNGIFTVLCAHVRGYI